MFFVAVRVSVIRAVFVKSNGAVAAAVKAVIGSINIRQRLQRAGCEYGQCAAGLRGRVSARRG